MNILHKNKYKKLPKGMILIFTLMMLLIMVLLGTAVVTSSKFTSNVSFNAATAREALVNADTTLRLSLRGARVYNSNLINVSSMSMGAADEAKFIGYCNNRNSKNFNIAYSSGASYWGVEFFHDIFYNRRVADIRYETALMLDVLEESSKQLPYERGLRLSYNDFSSDSNSQNRCPYSYWGDDYEEDVHGNELSEKGQMFQMSSREYLGAGALNFNWQTAGDVGGVSIIESGGAVSEDTTGGPVIIAGVTASGGYQGAKASSRGNTGDRYNTPSPTDPIFVFSLPTALITSFYTVTN